MSKQNLEVVSDVHFTGPTESQNQNYKYDMLLSHLYSLSSGTPMVSDQTNKYKFYVNNVEYTVPGVYVQPLNIIGSQPVQYIFSGSDYIDKQDDTLGIGDIRLLISSETVAGLLNGNALKIITEQINGRSEDYTINSTDTPDYKVIQTFIPYGHNIVFKRLAFRDQNTNKYSYSKFWIDWCAQIGPTYDPEYDGDNKFLFKTPNLKVDEISAFQLNGVMTPKTSNVNLGTLNKPFGFIYGTNGLFTQITTSNSGYGTKRDLFGSNGILEDINERLSSMGFSGGHQIEVHTVDPYDKELSYSTNGWVAKLGPIIYGYFTIPHGKTSTIKDIQFKGEGVDFIKLYSPNTLITLSFTWVLGNKYVGYVNITPDGRGLVFVNNDNENRALAQDTVLHFYYSLDEKHEPSYDPGSKIVEGTFRTALSPSGVVTHVFSNKPVWINSVWIMKSDASNWTNDNIEYTHDYTNGITTIKYKSLQQQTEYKYKIEYD